MSGNIRQRTVIGTLWSAVQKFGTVLIGFISNMILARLLTPDDFGCIAMLAIFIVIADTFVDSGLGSAVIQKKEVTDKDLSTVFYFNVELAVVLYGLLFIIASFVAEFYEIPLLCSVLRVEGLVLIINSFSVVQTALLRKELRFKELATAILVGQIIGIVVAIIMAYRGFGVWALVWQILIAALIRMFGLWLLSRWYPIWAFSKDSFKQLFGFGSFIFLSNLINNIGNNAEGLILGRCFNASTLGYFSQARKLEDVISKSISGVLDQVTYPALAKKQDDFAGIVKIMRSMIKIISFITFPILILLIITGNLIIPICYGSQWNDSIPMFQILCIAGLAVCLQGLNYYAVAAIGKSKALFNWTVIKRIIALCLLILGLLWGIQGFLIGFVIGTYITLLINAYLVQIYLKYSLKEQFIDISPILLVSGVTGFIGFIVSKIVTIMGADFIKLLIISSVFILIYLILSRIFKLEPYTEIVKIIKDLQKYNHINKK